MSFCIHKSNIALCNNERIILYNLEDDTENTISLPTLSKKAEVHNNVDIETYHMITNILFSNDGSYFLVCTNRKQLCLYETKSQKLLSNRTLIRAASKVRFTPNKDIIVADKAGDVYLFSSNAPTEKGTLILGHLSMLLDVLVTEDEKYILTTDRDEKIRVSMFPNSYNIVTYCLGHTKFVTNISELPHDERVIVSAGGDGEFILWHYINGYQLYHNNFSQHVPKHDIHKLNRDLQNCHLEESEILPVKHLRLSALGEKKSLLIISFHCSNILLVYDIVGTVELGISVTYIESVNVSDEPIECILCNLNLWVLTNSGFKLYTFKNNSFELQGTSSNKLDVLNCYWESLKNNTLVQKLFPILYKRKFDNIQEYLGRKKTRLINISE